MMVKILMNYFTKYKMEKLMDKIEILGWFALIVSVIYTSFGLPVQIIKNIKNKSTEGLSFLMFLMMFITYSSWVLYAFAHTPPDWFIIVPNSIGMLGALIIMLQFYLYKNLRLSK